MPAERLPDWTVQPERGGGAKLIITEGETVEFKLPATQLVARCTTRHVPTLIACVCIQPSLHVCSMRWTGPALLF